jgi:hypothetical protein
MGSLCLATILFILAAIWINYGESYLSLTHKVPADILVVEGWIGRKALRAAVDEFDHSIAAVIATSLPVAVSPPAVGKTNPRVMLRRPPAR